MGADGADANVQRWRRYGRDRLYVTDAAGQPLGWVDLASGVTTVDRPETTVIVQESVRAFCAEQGLPNPLLAAVVTSAATANQRSSRPRQRHPGGRIWVGKHQVRVNGFATDYLRKSRAEAARASKLLTAAVGFEVAVRPTLVFLTGSVIPNITISSSQRTC